MAAKPSIDQPSTLRYGFYLVFVWVGCAASSTVHQRVSISIQTKLDSPLIRYLSSTRESDKEIPGVWFSEIFFSFFTSTPNTGAVRGRGRGVCCVGGLANAA